MVAIANTTAPAPGMASRLPTRYPTTAIAMVQIAASIPMFGKINSLNDSAAAAVLLYEAVRQRTGN